MAELHLEIVTPERLVFDGSVDQVTIPGADGQFTVLKDHAPLFSSIVMGGLYYLKAGHRVQYVVNTGFVRVFRNHVTVLVDTAEKGDVISGKGSVRAKQRTADDV